MKPLFSAKSITGERRRHERVDVSYTAQVHVTDEKGKRVGVLRQLSRGGFMMEPETEKEFKEGKKHKLILVDRSENMRLTVKVVVRYADIRRAGFEFEGMDINSAIEIGILIGKYYQTDAVLV
jgi:c-di-GMP-binding flagellar brake protein YcgR